MTAFPATRASTLPLPREWTKVFLCFPEFSTHYHLIEIEVVPITLDFRGLLSFASSCFPHVSPDQERPMPKITKRVVDALKPAGGKDVFIWDSELRGFGVRMKPSGAASFLIQYRILQGQTRRLTFAKVGTLTPEEARAKARELLAEVVKGNDPSRDRHKTRQALTVAELSERYMEAARAGLVSTRFGQAKRLSTIAIDEGRISRHIVPLIGSRIASSLTRHDVQRMADDIAVGKTAAVIKTKPRGVSRVTGGAGNATRIVGLLGGIFTWAEKRGLVSGANPCHGLELRADGAEDRMLSSEELVHLGKVLHKHKADAPLPVAALRLIALTGLRRAEAYGLRWNEIDFEGSCVRLGETKSGRSMRAIGTAAVEHLRSLLRIVWLAGLPRCSIGAQKHQPSFHSSAAPVHQRCARIHSLMDDGSVRCDVISD
jgi:hypothetical protein